MSDGQKSIRNGRLNDGMQAFLEHSEMIDWQTDEVHRHALDLANGLSSKEAIAKRCFEFVRDGITHSWDHQVDQITCQASEVLQHGTGYCYAKSHLLAALLRVHAIPAALCYQRLTIDGERPPYCLHGLNAIFLQRYGWFRVDARGNKAGVSASFCPPREQLAFSILHAGERDFSEKFSRPLKLVVSCLRRHATYLGVAENLPDAENLDGCECV